MKRELKQSRRRPKRGPLVLFRLSLSLLHSKLMGDCVPLQPPSRVVFALSSCVHILTFKSKKECRRGTSYEERGNGRGREGGYANDECNTTKCTKNDDKNDLPIF